MVVALHFLQKKQNTSHLFSHNILHLNRRKSLFFSSIPRVPTNSSWFTRIAKMSFWWCLGCEKCLWSQEAFVLYFSVDRSRNGEEFIKGSYSCPSQSQKLYLLVFFSILYEFLETQIGAKWSQASARNSIPSFSFFHTTTLFEVATLHLNLGARSWARFSRKTLSMSFQK